MCVTLIRCIVYDKVSLMLYKSKEIAGVICRITLVVCRSQVYMVLQSGRLLVFLKIYYFAGERTCLFQLLSVFGRSPRL